MVAAVGRLGATLVKEVADAIRGVGLRFMFENVSLRVLVIDELPLIESIDTAGEMPSLAKDRRLRGLDVSVRDYSWHGEGCKDLSYQ